MDQICRIKYGSHLYGTNLPESDQDYKYVAWPQRKDILLCKAGKNLSFEKTNDDIEIFSLHRFVELALQGQTVAIEMLFAPSEQSSPEWDFIVAERQKFLSQKLKAFSGYARTQMYKYSAKAKHLEELHNNLEVVDTSSKFLLGHIWDKLKIREWRINPQGFQEFRLGNKWFAENLSLGYVSEILNAQKKKYGLRVQKCSNNKDWKSIAHALRISQELLELCRDGKISFPRPNANYLKEIRLGKIKYEQVVNEIELCFAALEVAILKLPKLPQAKFWTDWLELETLNYLNV